MRFARTRLLALSAALLAIAARAQTPPATKIDHTPLAKSARGEPVTITAKIENPSTLFAPQVYARPTGTTLFHGFTMTEKKRRPGVFSSRLPGSFLNDGALEYFIEARSETGDAARAGSPSAPLACVAFDPPPVPVACLLKTEVAGAEVRIDGDVVGKTPLTISLAPGPHTITISAPDGRSAEKQIDVRSGSKKIELDIPLPANAGGPASLTITSEPTAAKVLVDGSVAGVTPYSAPVSAGDHVVAVEMDGRLRQERKVTAREGRDASIAFALPALPKDPALTLESDPVGALVFIDGKERGRTPFIGPLSGGSHQVVLKKEGHREVGTDFNMPRDHDMSLRLELPKGSGSNIPRLTVSTDPLGATVLVDGKEVGPSPWSGELRTGEHKVQVKLENYKSDERKVLMASGRDADVAFGLVRAPGPGKLRIETEPPNAKVSIDGQDLGFSPYSGDVPTGEHQLEVSLANYRGVAQTINLEAGQQLSLKLALQEAAKEKLPPLIAVASDPQGAELQLDGKTVGNTPVKARSTPGPHEIKLILDGYTTRTGKINLPDSKDFELRMAISLKPLRGTAETHSAPDQLELARSQLKRAQACYKQGDWKCALEAYQVAYQYKPIPELLFNIAQTRRKMGQYEEAAVAYKNFAKETTSPKLKDEAQRYATVCDIALHPEKQAQLEAEQTAANKPQADLEAARAALSKAQGCYKTADWACALEGYQAAYQFKRIPDLLFNIAQARRKLGQYDEAETAYKNFQKETTNEKMKGEAEKYIAACEAALHPEAAGSEQKAQADLEAARASLSKAQACYKTADWPCALEGYQSAYQFKRIPELLFNIAQTRRKMGQYAEAQVAYRNFQKETTNEKMKGEAEKYVAVCEQALNPSAAVAASAGDKPQSELDAARNALAKAQACYKTADYACALEGYQAAYQYKRVPELLFNVAQARRKLGQYAEAEAAYKSFQKDTDNEKMKGEADKYIDACELALHPEQAEKLRLEQVALEDARAALGKAQACFKTAEWQCALENYQAAYQYKRAPELLYNIAQTRRKLGQYDEAQVAYKSFTRESTNSKMVAEAEKNIALCDAALHPTEKNSAQVAAAKASTAGATPVAVSEDSLHSAETSVEAQTAIASQAGATSAGSPAVVVAAVDEKELDLSKEVLGAAKAEPAAPPLAREVSEKEIDLSNDALGTARTLVAKTQKGATPPLPDAADEKAVEVGGDALGKNGSNSSKNMFAADDDTDPPVITHKKIEKAFRGQALRILARIVDERSDVGNAQACWKNVFQTEYKCAPLIKIGEDEFGVEVPAKAVSDGFSYYLEAYDTAENGPARAGAPELPNPVIIEDVPPPKALETKPAAVAEISQEEKERIAREVLGQKEVPKPPEQKNHILSYIGIGSAVAVVAAGVGLQLHANSSLNSLTQGGLTRTQQDSIRSQASTEQTVSYILFGASGALALGAAAFWNTNF